MDVTAKDYSSIYSIKELAINDIAPKYFDLEDINQLNIGLFGFNTEMISTVTEDTFNGISTFLKEIFPNKATIPDSIYNYASLFQLEELFANPSHLDIVLFVNEQDVVNLGANKISFYEFVIDSQLIVDIEGKQFTPDYNIKIIAKPYKDDYIFTAQYDFNFINSISNISNPYIKIKRIKYSGNNYLGLFIQVRQINKNSIMEQLITNDKINFPTFTIDFNDQLANFEVFYKSPDLSNFIQLKKRLLNTPALKEPFCYYKFKNENQITISFSSNDKYFQPKFNSDFQIDIFTTTGIKGNFPLYKGNTITVIPKSEKYPYNNSIIIFAIPRTASTEGRDYIALEELRAIVVEKFSTVDSFTNENDLTKYFSNFKYRYGNDILFVKKRDDAFERLFSAFALLKDLNNDTYPTNTLHLSLTNTDFDIIYEQSNQSALKAGHVFRYKDISKDTVELIPNLMLNDDLTTLPDEYVFTNPFLITVGKSPGVVGYYLNSVNQKLDLEYSYVNENSIVQFICNNISIYRNALNGEEQYKLTIIITPTLELEEPLATKVDDVITDLQLLKLKLMIEDTIVSTELGYLDFVLKDFDEINSLYTFEAILKTDDYITLAERLRCTEIKDIVTSEVSSILIPMSECKLNIYAFYKYTDLDVSGNPFKIPHQYDYIPELTPYTLTNMYSTINQKANFINSLNIVRSQVKFTDIDETNYGILVYFIPFISAETMKDIGQYDNFMQNLTLQFEYMQDALSKITNNYSIDMKFYNTYGKSRNFTAGEDSTLLDTVNTSINFRVKSNIGIDVEDLTRDLKIFIKNYVESINSEGTNAIYISNLITEIETNFEGVKYLKFVNINNYDSSVQIIENTTSDITLLTKDERKNFVPEYLTIKTDDISIEII